MYDTDSPESLSSYSGDSRSSLTLTAGVMGLFLALEGVREVLIVELGFLFALVGGIAGFSIPTKRLGFLEYVLT